MKSWIEHLRSGFAREMPEDRIAGGVCSTGIGENLRRHLPFFHLKSRERRIDQARLVGRIMALFAPGEWNPRPLPDAVYPLSLFCRPIPLACLYGSSLLRARGLMQDGMLARSLFQLKNARGQWDTRPAGGS